MIEEDYELPHGGSHRELLGHAGRQEVLLKHFRMGSNRAAYRGGHEEHSAADNSSALDHSSASARTTVSVATSPAGAKPKKSLISHGVAVLPTFAGTDVDLVLGIPPDGLVAAVAADVVADHMAHCIELSAGFGGEPVLQRHVAAGGHRRVLIIRRAVMLPARGIAGLLQVEVEVDQVGDDPSPRSPDIP